MREVQPKKGDGWLLHLGAEEKIQPDTDSFPKSSLSDSEDSGGFKTIKSRLFSSARGWRPIHLCRFLTICTRIDVILEASNYLGVDEVAKKMRGRTDVN